MNICTCERLRWTEKPCVRDESCKAATCWHTPTVKPGRWAPLSSRACQGRGPSRTRRSMALACAFSEPAPKSLVMFVVNGRVCRGKFVQILGLSQLQDLSL